MPYARKTDSWVGVVAPESPSADGSALSEEDEEEDEEEDRLSRSSSPHKLTSAEGGAATRPSCGPRGTSRRLKALVLVSRGNEGFAICIGRRDPSRLPTVSLISRFSAWRSRPPMWTATGFGRREDEDERCEGLSIYSVGYSASQYLSFVSALKGSSGVLPHAWAQGLGRLSFL